jgi:hypothetical protein
MRVVEIDQETFELDEGVSAADLKEHADKLLEVFDDQLAPSALKLSTTIRAPTRTCGALRNAEGSGAQ